MGKFSCRQLGGACDLVFEADTFDEIAIQSKNHGKEMLDAGDEPHVAAMNEMMTIVSEGGFDEWQKARREEFDQS